MKNSRAPSRPRWRSRSDREALTAAALSGNIGIAKLQALVQTLTRKIHDRAIEVHQTFGIVDFAREGLNEGLEFRNPNVAGECGCGESFTV